MGVHWKASDGTGVVEQIGSVPNRGPIPMSWSADGKTLVTQEIYEGSKIDIGTLSMEGDHTRKLLLKEEYNESHPYVSPDGRWLAYCSDESGKPEIYVRPFPEVDKGKWQISSSGGNSPLWSPDGRELFYLTGTTTSDAAMRVAVETQPTFKSGKPEVLFRGTYVGFYPSDFPWDIHPDGKRFLLMKEAGAASAEGGPQKINIVLNWFEELKQRVPVK
jgi:serine/threonine-protein kinase